MKIYTKKALINKLKDITNQGWIKNTRRGNHGGIGNTLEDFDARTGHNHGTKFRMRQNCLPNLYRISKVIV